MSKKIKAYVYIRFGNCEEIMSEEEMQKKLIEEYLQKREKNISINFYIDKGYSGLNFNRPSFKKMLKDIETNKVDMVVVKSYSKLTRNSFQLINFIENILKPRNIKLISLREENFYYEIPKTFIDELKKRMIV